MTIAALVVMPCPLDCPPNCEHLAATQMYTIPSLACRLALQISGTLDLVVVESKDPLVHV